ncbi:MAG: sodium-dependent transporter [Planctomycetota bacterium]|jgi:NSS family neurotransmitter:Na+ symporter
MARNLDASVDQRFSSRLGFLLSVIGIAVGTGNIWRFPRIAAQNGSEVGAGAFLVAWTAFLFLWSIPLVLAEYAMGRKCRMGVVGTITRIAGEKFAWMGAFMTFVTAAITFFYSVVLGWCLYYFIQMLTNPLPLSTKVAMSRWNDYQGSGWPLVTHAVVMGFGAFAIWRGVRSIERVNKILIPTLLGIVLISVVRGLTLPGAWAGVAYLFRPDWGQLSRPTIWMEALTQNAWDVGAGWGLYLTYAAYVRREHGVVKNGFITPIGNNLVSMLAALMLFATVFAILRTEMKMDAPTVCTHAHGASLVHPLLLGVNLCRVFVTHSPPRTFYARPHRHRPQALQVYHSGDNGYLPSRDSICRQSQIPEEPGFCLGLRADYLGRIGRPGRDALWRESPAQRGTAG